MNYANQTNAKVDASAPKNMTAVDAVNSRLNQMNGHAQEHIEELTSLLNRAGFGKPANPSKGGDAGVLSPGFLGTEQALNSLQEKLHQIGGLIADARQIA